MTTYAPWVKVPHRPTPDEIISECANKFGVTPDLLLKPRDIWRLRGLMLHEIHERCGMSWPEIARAIGHNSHSTLHRAAHRARNLTQGTHP